MPKWFLDPRPAATSRRYLMRSTVSFQFHLPRGAVVCEVCSDDRRVLSQVAHSNGRIRVPPGTPSRADLRIHIEALGQGYVVRTPTTRYELRPRGQDLEIERSWDGQLGDLDAWSHSGWGPPPASRRFVCSYEGKEGQPESDPTVAHVSSLLEVIVLGSLCEYDPDLGCFHAAAVARGDRCVLLVGETGSGKTTSALALCALGWRLLGDDVVPIDLRDARAHPVPRRSAIREDRAGFTLRPFLEEHESGADHGLIRANLFATDRWHSITDVVFLGQVGARPRLNPIAGVSGLIRLSRAAFAIPGRRSPARLLSLARCFGSVRWWECELGHPIATSRALTSRIQQPDSSAPTARTVGSRPAFAVDG
jgi:hypothetical protein